MMAMTALLSRASRLNGGSEICAIARGRSTGLSTCFEVLRRFLSTVADQFILHCLSLVEGAQPGSLHGRNVNKHVLAAALRLNESIALGRVEPLHSSGSHRCLLANHDVRCRCRES